MAGRGLPDLRPATNAELIKAWRERGKALDELAATIRAEGDTEFAQDLENAANDYYIDASKLELEEERVA